MRFNRCFSGKWMLVEKDKLDTVNATVPWQRSKPFCVDHPHRSYYTHQSQPGPARRKAVVQPGYTLWCQMFSAADACCEHTTRSYKLT